MTIGAESPPGHPRKLLHGCLVLVFFAVAAVLLTWPLAAPTSHAVAARDDYFVNQWNFWWIQQSLLEDGQSPFHTEMLHYPAGISLALHTLSLANAVPGALLLGVTDVQTAFRILLLVHFWLAGWVFFLFARELSGSHRGAILAGLVWSFCPYHFHFLPELNVATLETLPLLGLFVVRTYRHGRIFDFAGLVVAAALLAATSGYYLVFGALLGALLLASGRLWSPTASARLGALRLALAAAPAAMAVVLVIWPLLFQVITGADLGGGIPAGRWPSSDLLGFSWVGPPGRAVVSWPSMFGYSTLLLASLAFLRERRVASFWLAMLGLFLVLSLGPSLWISGRDTGLTMPYSWLSELPLLGWIRRPNRFHVMAQLFLCLLCALGWQRVNNRLPTERLRTLVWTIIATTLVVEMMSAPLTSFDIKRPSAFERLDAREDVTSLVDLPPFGGGSADGRINYYQTIHGKRIAQGYVTNLALTTQHHEQSKQWRHAHKKLREGNAEPLVKTMDRLDIDAVVFHKTEPVRVRRSALAGELILQPWRFVAAELVKMRQRGPYLDSPIPRSRLALQRNALQGLLGPPILEDELVAIFTRESVPKND